MICINCGNTVSDKTVSCPKCGYVIKKSNKQLLTPNTKKPTNVKKIVFAIAVLALIIIVAAFGLLSFGGPNRKSANGIVKKEDIGFNKGFKVYKVNADSKITKEDMDSIVYYLQTRANDFSSESEVRMKKYQSNWYVGVSIPGISGDSIYEEVIKNVELKFVGDYDSDEPEVIVTNQNIVSAYVSAEQDAFGGKAQYVVKISFDANGAKAFADGTSKYLGSQISIVLDGTVISAPRVSDVITDGEVIITGVSYEEAEGLAALLSFGYLGFELEEIE